MEHMLALFPKGMVPNFLFLTLFLRRLPANMRDQLATQDIFAWEAMAVGANSIFTRPHDAMVVAAVS
jgi:hypothetical protein